MIDTAALGDLHIVIDFGIVKRLQTACKTDRGVKCRDPLYTLQRHPIAALLFDLLIGDLLKCQILIHDTRTKLDRHSVVIVEIDSRPELLYKDERLSFTMINQNRYTIMCLDDLPIFSYPILLIRCQGGVNIAGIC